MSPEVERLLDRVAQLPSEQRTAFLLAECPDTHLRDEVKALLRHAASAESFLEEAVRDAASSLNPYDELSPGDRVGAYRIVSLIGSGGMGKIYLAERADGTFDQQVAVKVVQSGNIPLLLDRFKQERCILGLLNHPNIARILDAGQTASGLPYFSMEYVSGQPIDQFCDSAKLALRERLELFLKICDAVRHAHQSLVIHRDLKPANIVVTEMGEPKLLDFGIAKIIDSTCLESTARLLTPAYASPEQIRGDPITTATDVYSLGAVLYKILAGRSPRQAKARESETTDVSAGGRRNLPEDIDYVLGKALRDEPRERYSSVDAFASDIRAYLDRQPIKARSNDALYRAQKFLRRHGVAVSALTMTVVSLSLGLYTSNHERAIAQRRFLQVRHLSNKVLALDQLIAGSQSSTKTRHEIVAMSKDYLEALGVEAHADQDLALDISEAYTLLARAQGVSVVTNLGQYAQAAESLQKAAGFVGPVLLAHPDNRKGLLISARISHDRMILAGTDHRNDQALTFAREAVGHLDRLFSLGSLSEGEYETVSRMFVEIAVAHKNVHLFDEAVGYARRSIEISRLLPNAEVHVIWGLSILADLLRLSGNVEGALQSIREARVNLDKARFTSESARRSAMLNVLWREGKILGAASGISLNRPNEAIIALQKLFDLAEDWARNDPNDAWSRLSFAAVGRELGDLLRRRDPQRALAVYDHSILRLREIADNTVARRGEIEILAASAYPLRYLDRMREARERIDAAFRLLDQMKEYPADRIIPHTESHAALRALADHFAETGRRQRALDTYQDLLAKIMAAKPDPRNDLGHAMALSQIYETLARLHRRKSQRDQAETFSVLRLELWRDWGQRFPDSSLIRRQIEAAGL